MYNLKQSIKTLAVVAITCVLFVNRSAAQASKSGNIHYITGAPASFDSLISKFKGKIIYVDMWATWCHPCRLELQKTRDIQAFSDFALKNDIVILYISWDNNRNSWKWFIANHKLTGYHIIKNDSLNTDLHQRFSYELHGKMTLKYGFYIPRHLIIDQKGAIVDSMADPQGSVLVYARLNKLIANPPR